MNEERLKFAQRFTEVAAILGYEGHGRQSQLARYYNLKQPSVKKWFDGEAMPEYEICVDLCKRARVHFEWFMTDRGPKSIDEVSIDDPQIAHALKILQQLAPEKLDQAVKIVDTFARP